MNGFIRVDDRRSGLSGLFYKDGNVRHGSLTTKHFNEAMSERAEFRKQFPGFTG
jgi:hypothetical protein